MWVAMFSRFRFQFLFSIRSFPVFPLIFLCLFRFTAVIFYYLFAVATAHRYTHTKSQDADDGSAVVECRRESAALVLPNGGKHVSSAALGSLACALGSTTTRSHPWPHSHTQRQTALPKSSPLYLYLLRCLHSTFRFRFIL